MLVLGFFGIIAAEFAFSMRLEATMARHFKEEIVAQHLAEAGVQQAIREFAAAATQPALDRDGQLVFYKDGTKPLPIPARKDVALGQGRFSYRISNEESRINLNTAPTDVLDRLLSRLGVEKDVRDTIVSSIQDWKDPDEFYRLNGAESDDYYLKLPAPYRSKNANFDAVSELLQVKGVTRQIYDGTAEEPGLAEFLTVTGSGQVNINTASETVLKALGLSEAEISEIRQTRENQPYTRTTISRFGGRGLVTEAQHFRVESIGLVDGQPRYRISAVIQRKLDTSGGFSPITLSWHTSPRFSRLP
jgi:general secretion pathway protein K